MIAVRNNNVGAVRVLGRVTRIQWSKEELLSRASGNSSMLQLVEELDQERKKTKDVKNAAVARDETERKIQEEIRRQKKEKRGEEEKKREEEQASRVLQSFGLPVNANWV